MISLRTSLFLIVIKPFLNAMVSDAFQSHICLLILLRALFIIQPSSDWDSFRFIKIPSSFSMPC